MELEEPMKQIKPMAAVYARVSLEEQASNYSLASQVRGCRKLAAEKGFAVSDDAVFVDPGFSGSEFDRPALTRLRDAVRGGLIQAVVCFDPDRLSRKLAHLLLLTEECEKASIALLFVNGGGANESPETKMLLSMRGVFAEFEKTKFAERVARGRREKAQQGFVNGGRSPYGYAYLGKAQGKRGELAINEEQAATVRRIFKWAADGVGPGDIARKLIAEGVCTISGKPWAKPVIVQMLRNTVYAGEGFYNRTVGAEPKTRRKDAPLGLSKKTSARFRDRAEWIPLATPAIVSRALFDRVRAQIERNRGLNSGRPAQYLLRCLMRCGACGFSCCVFPNKGKPRYRCTNRDRLTSERKCPQPSMAVPSVEREVIEATIAAFETPAHVYAVMADGWALAGRNDKQLQKERADLGRSIAKLRQREQFAAQALLDRDLEDAYPKFRDALKEAQSQRRALEARLAQLRPVPPPPALDLERYIERVEGLRDLPPEQQREVIRDLIERVELKDGVVTIHYKLADAAATNRIEQVRQVRACQQQEHQSQREKNGQRSIKIDVRSKGRPPQRIGGDRVRSLVRIRKPFYEALHQDIQLIFCLAMIDSRLELAEHVEPWGVAILDSSIRAPNLRIHAKRYP
jgi:site-specific DNA recombinase